MTTKTRKVTDTAPTAYLDAAAKRLSEDAMIACAMAIIEARKYKRGEFMADPVIAGTYLKLRLANRDREVFAVIFLDSRHRIIACEEIFYGTVDGAEVHPREVAKAALRHNAVAVILGHNHPSGSAEPSAADRAVTARLKQALALIEIRVLDHFIIGDGPPASMARQGLL